MNSDQTKSITICRKLCDLTDELRDMWLQRQSRSRLREITGLTVNQGRLFRVVWRMTENFPQGVMLRDLAERLGLSSSAVSVMVESLVQKGCLERITDQDDRRKVMIRLAEKGVIHRGDTEKAFGSIISGFIAECDLDKWNCFEEVLDGLNQYLSQKQGECEREK